MNDPGYTPERRPIRSRELSASKRAGNWLAVRGVSPNAISVAGMAAGIAAGAALAFTGRPGVTRPAFIAAAVLMQARLLANMLDGIVAVARNVASPLGELYNEVPDRVSDSAIFIGAGYAVGSAPMLGALTACVALFIAYVRAEGKVAGAPQEFCGPMAKPERMFVVTLCALYCGLAPPAWQPWVTMAGQRWGVMAAGLMLIIVGGLWTSARRLSRIARALKPHES
jgi:phosphatidylglycerophosphate synthase